MTVWLAGVDYVEDGDPTYLHTYKGLLTPHSVCKSRVPIFDADKVALFHSLPAAFSTLFTHLPPHHFSNSVSFQLISKCSLDFEQSSYAGIFKNHTNFLSFFSFFFSLHDSLKEKERTVVKKRTQEDHRALTRSEGASSAEDWSW